MPVRFCEYYLSKHFAWSTENTTHNSVMLPHTWKQFVPLQILLLTEGLFMKCVFEIGKKKIKNRATEYTKSRLKEVVPKTKELNKYIFYRNI